MYFVPPPRRDVIDQKVSLRLSAVIFTILDFDRT